MDAIYIALGSNLAGRFENCMAVVQAAVQRLDGGPIRLARVSPFYRTAAVGGPPGQGDYINAVAALHGTLPPCALLNYLHIIEAEFGRKRRVKWGARVLDLDILDYYGCQQTIAPLLPHPRLHVRNFVLRPLADIAPAWRHPVTGQTVADLRHALPAASRQNIQCLSGGLPMGMSGE